MKSKKRTRLTDSKLRKLTRCAIDEVGKYMLEDALRDIIQYKGNCSSIQCICCPGKCGSHGCCRRDGFRRLGYEFEDTVAVESAKRCLEFLGKSVPRNRRNRKRETIRKR
jgi:hypothetical protein